MAPDALNAQLLIETSQASVIQQASIIASPDDLSNLAGIDGFR